MIYFPKKDLHSDFSVFEVNKAAPRAYAVPYSSRETLAATDVRKERYASDMTVCLSGEWDFKFWSSARRLPDKLDTLRVQFDRIPVPGDWQRNGYQEPVYLNCPYEIKTMAPEVPADMPVGVYRRFFDLPDAGRVRYLTFLGAANNIAVYLNGSFAGYSEGSHNSAEFDVTPYCQSGANELVVVMYKWCNGTFLEAQDMFRENGIFRDVLLTTYPDAFLYDYAIRSEKAENGYAVAVEAEIRGEPDGFLKAELIAPDGTTLAAGMVKAEAGKNTVDLGVNSVTEWNAEIPTLYTVYITLESAAGETMTVRNLTGFKTVTIEDGVYRFNGQPVKFKGVNHHDTHPKTGYAMTFEDMETDIRLMKRLNVNAVRTSHYPPDPFFLTLADLYGLYIVDEADIETHGCWEMAGDINFISHDPKWQAHYVDRVKRMYYRDRSHPSIAMWSLGNEAGGYKNQDACYQFLKSTGTTIPVHYEGVVNTRRFHYDVISEMYTSTENMELMMAGKRKRNDRVCREYGKYPFFLCEYAHAMGLGPGNLDEYWDLIYAWDNSMGGCIWEWADHAVWHPENDKKYKYRYTYGGDHGEKQHDGHFCVDGLVYGNRSLHTGAKEMRAVYRPLRASAAGKNLYCFENTNRFRDSAYIRVDWTLRFNGEAVETGSLTPVLPPMGAECFAIGHREPDPDRDCHIDFTYVDMNEDRVLASEQLTLNDVPLTYDIEIGPKIAAESENGIVTVRFENGRCVFDAATGDLTSYEVCGKELLATPAVEAAGLQPNLYRALIDNDAAKRDEWKKGGLNRLRKQLKSFDVSLDDGEVLIDAVFDLRYGRRALYAFALRYCISARGAIEVKASLAVLSEKAVTDLPRFGVTLELAEDLEAVRYYGRGPAENMPDFNAQATVGIYDDAVSKMLEPYVYPQESGVHCDTKWLRLASAGGAALTVYADDRFAFSAHHVSQRMIDEAGHQEDLTPCSATFLSLDGALRGIGSSSCGPDTRAEYRLNAAEGYDFSFTLIPEQAE